MAFADALDAAARWAPRAAAPLPAIASGSDEWNALAGYGGAGGPVSEAAVLSVSAVYACAQLIAGAIASLPALTYRLAGAVSGGTLADAPVQTPSEFDWLLNEQMSPRWAAPAGWELVIQSLLLRGDGFAEIERGFDGQVTALQPLRWSRVTPYVTTDGRRLVYTVSPDTLAGSATAAPLRVLDQDDIIHVPGFGFDGRRGMSPLRYWLRGAGGMAVAVQDYAREFFENQARGDYYFRTERDLGPDQLEKLKDQAWRSHGERGQRHKPMVLSGGLDVKSVSLPFEDIQMIETRRFGVEEVARCFGVPPHMIGHTDKTTSWGAGVETMGKNFVRFALRRHLTAIEAELNRKLIRRAGRFIEFDTEALERGDFKSMTEGYRTLVGRSGERQIVTQDEARRRLRLPAVGGNAGKINEPVGSATTEPPPADEPPPARPPMEE